MLLLLLFEGSGRGYSCSSRVVYKGDFTDTIANGLFSQLVRHKKWDKKDIAYLTIGSKRNEKSKKGNSTRTRSHCLLLYQLQKETIK